MRRGGAAARGETTKQLATRCKAQGIAVKAAWSKQRLLAALALADKSKPLWLSFDAAEVKEPAARLSYGTTMIQQFLNLSAEDQKSTLRDQLKRFDMSAMPTNTPKERKRAFQLFAQRLTLTPDLPSAVTASGWRARQLPSGDHTVLSRLEADIDAIPGLEQLLSHVSQHLQNNWTYHLVGNSCDCHSNEPLGRFGAFAFHFLHGICHWTDNHAYCRVRGAFPRGHRQGKFPMFGPSVAVPQQRADVAKKLFDAMVRATRQYEDGRSHNGASAWLSGPVGLPFDATYDRANNDVGIDWATLQQRLIL